MPFNPPGHLLERSKGKSKTEIIRCLKRYVAREAYYLIKQDSTPNSQSGGVDVQESVAGSHYLSFALATHLDQAGTIPSVGSISDASDNALRESTIGLYRRRSVPAGNRVSR
ncbi:hypothetical protein WJ438_05120 [Streptomyces sp. GD-15H]|uniref:hypothetical protein n=1 Tax=Streptomyces sp. GD-15H TaxID=3129112 RepID=UPI0032538979